MNTWHSAYRNHAPAILAYLRTRTRPEIAEDILQETFVRAIRSDQTPERMRPYLLTIAHNLMVNSYRKKTPTLFSEAGGDAQWHERAAPEVSNEDSLDLQRLHEVLDEAVAQLSPDQRQAFELAVLEQQPYKEISRRTGWTIGQVKTNVFRARRAAIATLRGLLREPAA